MSKVGKIEFAPDYKSRRRGPTPDFPVFNKSDLQMNVTETRDAQYPDSLLSKLCDLARRSHLQIEDCWYSCGKSEDFCGDTIETGQCTCGADEHNAKVEELYQRLKRV